MAWAALSVLLCSFPLEATSTVGELTRKVHRGLLSSSPLVVNLTITDLFSVWGLHRSSFLSLKHPNSYGHNVPFHRGFHSEDIFSCLFISFNILNISVPIYRHCSMASEIQTSFLDIFYIYTILYKYCIPLFLSHSIFRYFQYLDKYIESTV